MREAAHGITIGSTPQTPMDKMTLSPKGNRAHDMSAPGQQSDAMNTQTIDHKSMRLKGKMNAVGSLGESGAFSKLEEAPSFKKVMPLNQHEPAARSSLEMNGNSMPMNPLLDTRGHDSNMGLL